MDKQQIKTAIHEALEERDGLTVKEHRDQHEFISMQIEEYQDRRARRERIKAQVGGWMVIMTLTAIGYAAWAWFIQMVNMAKKVSGHG